MPELTGDQLKDNYDEMIEAMCAAEQGRNRPQLTMVYLRPECCGYEPVCFRFLGQPEPRPDREPRGGGGVGLELPRDWVVPEEFQLQERRVG